MGGVVGGPTGDPLLDELHELVSRRRCTAHVYLDEALVAEHTALQEELEAALQYDLQHNEPSTSMAISERIVELEARMDERAKDFTFEGIGTTAWQKLLLDHPPTEEQRRRYDHNPLTFRPAAMLASSIEVTFDDGRPSHPKFTAASLAYMLDMVPLTEGDKLWLACRDANVGSDDRPKSQLVSAARLLSGASTSTPPDTGSLAEPSSGVPAGLSPSTSTTTPAG